MIQSPLLQYFADELRRARESANLTQEQLGAAINFAKSTVAMVETCQRQPKADFAKAVDKALGTDGRFERIREKLLTATATPDWFRPWVDYEREATVLRSYELAFIPGLLQTEEYARAVLVNSEDVDSVAAARMERQQILSRKKPPQFVAIIDESVLWRPLGGSGVMHRQLRRLAEAASQWIIQVVPQASGYYYPGLDGPLVIATVDGRDVVYTPTGLRGYIIDSPEAVAEAKQRWDAIRAEALSKRQSRDLIMEAAESWSSKS